MVQQLKRFLSYFLLLSMISSIGAHGINRMGDADLDGSVTAADAGLTLEAYLGLNTPADISRLADPDGDCAWSLRDVQQVGQAASGLGVIAPPVQYSMWFTLAPDLPDPSYASSWTAVEMVEDFSSSTCAAATLNEGLEFDVTLDPGNGEATITTPAVMTGGQATTQFTPINSGPGDDEVGIDWKLRIYDSAGGNPSIDNRVGPRQTTILAPVCGQYGIQPGEVCDDGNTDGCDGCAGDCSFAEGCGDGILNCGEVCDDGAQNGQPYVCGGTLFDYAGRAYCLHAANVDWYTARDTCAGEGSVLVTVSDEAENQAIYEEAVQNAGLGYVWIGLNDIHLEGTFVWESGEPVNYTNWAWLEPSNSGPWGEDCASFDPGINQYWNDIHCSNDANGFVCEYGVDRCDTDCGGTICGNGVPGPLEVCDDGNTVACDSCAADCLRLDNVCGDGVAECGESCDDGNTLGCDGCAADCSYNEGCGDGLLNCGEGCDDGANNGSGEGWCLSDCSYVQICGDWAQEGTEVCDNGNTESCDGCSGDCLTVESGCGDGIVCGAEVCDDGNTISCDGCRGDCLAMETGCGDGAVCGSEVCDDGNTADCDGCRGDCTAVETGCGDMFVCGAEACDDGNTESCDGCRGDCLAVETGCGDGAVCGGEVCDDGADNGAIYSCSGERFYHDGHLYCYSNDTHWYEDALAACAAEGGYLASIGGAAEDEAVYRGGGTDRGYLHWIGLNDLDVEGTFEWASGEPVGYTNWQSGYPSGADCTVYGNVQWFTTAYSNDLNYICEYEQGYCNSTCDGYVCGDGIVNGTEVCDDGNTVGCDGCAADCSGPEGCGDGVLNCGEVCDDGNTLDCDGCRGDCGGVETGCGDGFLCDSEVCDDGLNNGEVFACAGERFYYENHQYCRYTRARPFPGAQYYCDLEGGYVASIGSAAENDAVFDGAGAGSGAGAIIGLVDPQTGSPWWDSGEPYSYENWASGEPDLASAECTALTGTGTWEDIDCYDDGAYICEYEQGNCNASCDGYICGDGIANGAEVCDDANTDDCDGCHSDCLTLTACGDGIVCGAEQCDDGNTDNCDGCLGDCSGVPYCGDGFTCGLEVCDDGNTEVCDGCLSDCSGAPFCGDGILCAGETCEPEEMVPVAISQYWNGSREYWDTAVCGNRVIVMNRWGLTLFDISDNRLIPVDELLYTGNNIAPSRIVADCPNQRIYLAEWLRTSMQLVSFAGDSLSIAGTYHPGQTTRDLHLGENRGYLNATVQIDILDTGTVPPTKLGAFGPSYSVAAICGAPDRVYALGSEAVFEIYDVSTDTPVLLGANTTPYSGLDPRACVVDGDRLYIASFGGATCSLLTFDVAGDSPAYVDEYQTSGDGWDLAVHGDRLYLTCEDTGMHVFDTTGAAPVWIGSRDTALAKGIALDGRGARAVVGDYANAVRMLDVREEGYCLEDCSGTATCGNGALEGLEVCDEGSDNGAYDCVGTMMSYGGHVYCIELDGVTWTEAQTSCVDRGGYLLSVGDGAENQAVWDEIAAAYGNLTMWIGFSDVASEGTWVWESGEPAVYDNWYAGEPNNSLGGEDCAAFWHYYPSQWYDLQCNTLRDGYVCEFEMGHCGADCFGGTCGDGFVTHGEACDDGNTLEYDGCAGDCSY